MSKSRLDAWEARESYDAARLEPSLAELESSPSEDAREAAYCLAAALGRCRLFGVELGDDDGTLQAPVALAAAELARKVIIEWTARAHGLAEEVDEAVEGTEVELICEDVLTCRLHCWAVLEAVLEAVVEGAMATIEEGHPLAESLQKEVVRLGEAIAEYDDALRRQVSILSIVSGTGFLEDWRNALAAGYRDVLPWWLDGSLKKEAKRLEKETVATLPSEAVWRKLRERMAKKGG